MKLLAPPESHYLRAAQGWFRLGNHLEVNEEPERNAPQFGDATREAACL